MSRQVVVLGVVLSLLQVCDGFLTAVGIGRFGTEAEGNLILRHLMERIGHVPTLLLVKLLAVGVIVALCRMSVRVSWLPLALKGMIAVYALAAVAPWSYILFVYDA